MKPFNISAKNYQSMYRLTYEQGKSPCGACQTYKHKGCRPRLDGSLCSCSCAKAAQNREEYKIFAEYAAIVGDPVPVVCDVLVDQVKPRNKWPVI